MTDNAPIHRSTRRYAEPIRYEIGEGKDISQERFLELVEAVGEWYKEWRPDLKEPFSQARQDLNQCLQGVTKDGDKWFSMALSSFAKRVRSKCRYDIDAKVPLRKASEAQKLKKLKEKEATKRRKLATRDAEDELIPDELRREQSKKIKYGDDPNVLLSSEEEREWRRLFKGIIGEFPELDTTSGRAELEILCDLLIRQKRQRLKLLQGQPISPTDLEKVAEDVVRMKRSLGIHPEQLAKRVQSRTDTTIGAAAARFETLGDWRKLRQRFFAEEMLQAYQMFATPSADGLNYQLDEVGLFAITKSRVVCCPKCGERNFAGISIQEIEDWLVNMGYLKPVGEGEAPRLASGPKPDVQPPDAPSTTE